MSDEARRADEQADELVDPTAEFLADVRPEKTPWRIERPPVEPADSPTPDATERTRFTRAAGALGGVAPYLAAGGAAGWMSAQGYDEYADEGGAEGTGMGGEG